MLSISDVIVLPLTTVTYPATHPLAGQSGPVNAYTLRHPDGLILVDTGVGDGHPGIDEWYQPVHRPLDDALAAHGLALTDVVVVINSHLHFDHCGQNRRFPRIPIAVQATEYAAAHAPNFTIVEWVDFPGATYRQLAGETEIAPGVRVLPTPGHTPGHQSVLLDTDAGVVILAGQAAQSRAEFDHVRQGGALPGDNAPADPIGYLSSLQALIALHPAVVHFSHDVALWTATHA